MQHSSPTPYYRHMKNRKKKKWITDKKSVALSSCAYRDHTHMSATMKRLASLYFLPLPPIAGLPEYLGRRPSSSSLPPQHQLVVTTSKDRRGPFRATRASEVRSERRPRNASGRNGFCCRETKSGTRRRIIDTIRIFMLVGGFSLSR